MFTLATLKALQIYGIAIGISMLVAALIKLMVLVTNRLNKPVSAFKTASPAPRPGAAPTSVATVGGDIPKEVIAAISAALATITGPHRILHIAPSQASWSVQGRSAQHSHQPQRK